MDLCLIGSIYEVSVAGRILELLSRGHAVLLDEDPSDKRTYDSDLRELKVVVMGRDVMTPNADAYIGLAKALEAGNGLWKEVSRMEDLRRLRVEVQVADGEMLGEEDMEMFRDGLVGELSEEVDVKVEVKVVKRWYWTALERQDEEVDGFSVDTVVSAGV